MIIRDGLLAKMNTLYPINIYIHTDYAQLVQNTWMKLISFSDNYIKTIEWVGEFAPRSMCKTIYYSQLSMYCEFLLLKYYLEWLDRDAQWADILSKLQPFFA